MGLGSRNKVSVEFSMSSMTDIVFLLLIFFILLSTFITANHMDVDPPTSDGMNTGSQTVSVSISPDIHFYVNTDEVAEADLEYVLKEQLAGEAEPGIVLHADKTVPIKHVMTIMQIASRNKYSLILATQPR